MYQNAIEAKETMRTRAGDVAHHHSDNAELTPRSPERESGRSSAQWQGLKPLDGGFGSPWTQLPLLVTRLDTDELVVMAK